MKISKTKWLYLGIGLVLLFGFYLNPAAAYTINPSIPGPNPATVEEPNPVNIIGNFYQFALMLGGLLAFVIIVFAAIKHTVSADNPSGQSDAKDMIKQALLGLLLLAGAFIILNTINPKLTNLSLPTLDKIPLVKITVKVPGTLHSPCLGGSVCNTGLLCSSDNRCYKPAGCTATPDCPYLSFQKCIDGSCKEILKTCDASTPCGSVDSLSCVDGLCKQTGTAGAACINGGCQSGSGLVCSQPRNICVVSGTCLTSEDCPSPTTQGCVAGKCVAKTEGGGLCTSQTDCGGDLACGAGGQCLPFFGGGCQNTPVESEKCDAPYVCSTGSCSLPCSSTNSCPVVSDGTQLTCKLPPSGGSVKFCLR